jgi:hypothetical protein
MGGGSVALEVRAAARRIREILLAGAEVTFTDHALTEMAADHLTMVDVYQALRSCRVARREHDVRLATGSTRRRVRATTDRWGWW